MSEADRDAARDAWLSEALRHAPDADAVPPTALRESILAKARAAAAPRQQPVARTRTLGDVLRGWWIALARPPVAAGFASVMAATIVGLMWWDRPMDETMPRPPAPAARTAPTPTPATPTPAPPSEAPALADQAPKARASTSDAPVAPPAQALGRAQAPNPSPSSRSRDASADARVTPRDAASPARKAAAPTPFPAAEAPREIAREPVEEAKKDRAPSSFAGPSANVAPAEPATVPPSASIAAAPATRAAPAPSPASPESGRATGALRSEIAADRADKSLARSAAPALQSGPAGAALSRQRATDARASADSVERERPGAASSPLGSLLDAIARQPQRWTRVAADGSATALDAAWRAWLAELDAAVAGGWQRAGAGVPAADDPARDVLVLQLFLDGQPAATVRLDGRAARLDRLPDGPAEHWGATLPPDAASRLGAARSRLSP